MPSNILHKVLNCNILILLFIFLCFLKSKPLYAESLQKKSVVKANYVKNKIDFFHQDTLKCSKQIIQELKKNNYSKSIKKLNLCHPKDRHNLVILINWYRLTQLKFDNLNEDIKFIIKYSYYPEILKIYKYIEINLLDQIDNNLIIKLFSKHSPQTHYGYLKLASMSNKTATRKYIRSAFLSSTITDKEVSFLAKKYPNIITNNIIYQKLLANLFINKITIAIKLELLQKPSYSLIKYYNKLNRTPIVNIATTYFSFPKKIKNNPVILYRTIYLLEKADLDSNITTILFKSNIDQQYANKFWKIKLRQARFLLKKKQYQLAYSIASTHNLLPGQSHYYEAEWTSGWIALTFNDKPQQAYIHFYNMYNNVSFALSKARATYWLARASEDANKITIAQSWYNQAMQYPYHYYGQMAFFKNHKKYQIYNQTPAPTSQEMLNLLHRKSLAYLSILLTVNNEHDLAKKLIYNAIAQSKTKKDMRIILELSFHSNDFEYVHFVVKIASRKNIVVIDKTYPIIELIKNINIADLVMSIIRQESGFRVDAISSAGALGFMQIMPQTAKLTAHNIGLKYNKKRLLNDAKYNVTIGVSYIRQMLESFDNSFLLSIIAYNAGPHNATRWITEYGDPRDLNTLTKVINWVEMIPFGETRNYVQRIFEALIVYTYLQQNSNFKIQSIHLN